MVMAALFIISKKWGGKNPGFIHGWMDKQNMLCLYNGIVFSHEKEWGPDTCYSMDTLENILLSERGQSTKTAYCVSPCMWNMQNRKIWKDWKQTVLARGGQRVTVNGYRASFWGWWIPIVVMVVQLHEYNGVAISFSRESSWSRDWTQVSCIAGRLFTIWAIRKSYEYNKHN